MKKGQKKTAKTTEPEPEIENKGMTDVVMAQLLVELSESMYWPAYMRYVNARLSIADDSLRSVDPFKEPTIMARTQGARAGISDVPDYIAAVKAARLRKERGETNENPTGNA